MTESIEPSEPYTWDNESPGGSTQFVLPIVASAVGALLRETRQPRLTIVDIGCGNGFIASHLSEQGHRVIGIDDSVSGIEIARRRQSAGRFERCSLYDDRIVDLVEETADCVISLEVVEHLMSPGRLFEVAARLLRKDGLLVVSTPYHGYLKNLALSLTNRWDRHFDVASDAGHVKFFSNRSLAKMASEYGFDRQRFRGAGRLRGFWKSTVMSARKI